MAHDLYVYGSTEPIYFALVDSSGNKVTGHTFVTTDVYLVVDGGADIDVSLDCSEIGKGIYKWTPSSGTHTQRKVICLAITDSGGSTFIDNTVIMSTGGDASAFFSGT